MNSTRNVEMYAIAIARLSFSAECRRERNVEDRTFHNAENFTRWKHDIAIPTLRQIDRSLFPYYNSDAVFAQTSTAIDNLIDALQENRKAKVKSIYNYSNFDTFREEFLRIITPITILNIPALKLEREIEAILKVAIFDFQSLLIRIMAHRAALHHVQDDEISDLVMNAVGHGQVDYLQRLIDGYKHTFEHDAGTEDPRHFNGDIISSLCDLLDHIQHSLERQASMRRAATITSLRRDANDTEMARLSETMRRLRTAGSGSSSSVDPEMACLRDQIQTLQAGSLSSTSSKRRPFSEGGGSDSDSDSDSAEAREEEGAKGQHGFMVAKKRGRL